VVQSGKDQEEAIADIKEAIRSYIAALEEDNLPVPEERFETSGRECLRTLTRAGFVVWSKLRWLPTKNR
jgi:hypothetical protein